MLIHYLVTRNARDKIQVAIVSVERINTTYKIMRSTGQYQGKFIDQPIIIIEKGKSNRTPQQQAELEYKSIIKKYLDKGYKLLNTLTKKEYKDLTDKELESIVPSLKTDANGELKVMLAKDYNKCPTSLLQKPLWCSRKLNGVRMMVRFNSDRDEIITISRGGKDYDIPATLIREKLGSYLKEHKDIILDGELYVHGKHLQEISGIARLKTWEDRCEKLEYWIYDIASDKLTFLERLELLKELKKIFEKDSKIKVLEHVKTESWEQIHKLHDKWVLEGFEGLVARKPDKVYEFGKRGSTMIKVKMYQEEEFEIIDYSEKLRDEDFCFICKTKEGKVFEAKPIGTREQKYEYLEDMDNIIGKLGTIKFFEWSKDGVPLQPVFQAVRYDSDIS